MHLINTRTVTLSLNSDWPALFNPKEYNWVNFTFIRVATEYNKAGPQWELDLALFGFNLWFSVALPWKTEQSTEIHERWEEAKADWEETNHDVRPPRG